MVINWYGFFIALGILAGVLVVEYLRKKSSLLFTVYCLPSVFNILPWVLIPGIIGARLYHVVDYWKYYGENPRQIFLVWQGGLGIFGGILGAIVGLWIFLKFKVQSIRPELMPRGSKFKNKAQNLKFSEIYLSFLDLGVIGLSIGQAVGRWGNYFNQELYGLPTSLAWGIYIRPENRLVGLEGFSHFHPLFLYESLGCLVIFFVLLKLTIKRAGIDTNFCSVSKLALTALAKCICSKSKNRNTSCQYRPPMPSSDKTYTHKNCISPRAPGIIFFTYLFLYSFLRFWLEFLRIENWWWGGIRVNQLVSLGLMGISGFALLIKSDKIHFGND